MPSGDIISAVDYNNIRNKIIGVMGIGAGSFGYGQTLISSAVAVGNTVTKAQWDQLRFDIFNALLHQTGSSPSISQATIGDVITFGLTRPNSQYDTLSDTARNNRFNVGSGRFLENFGVSSATLTTAWKVSVQNTFTITFPNANSARYFFNSGGQLKVRTSRTGGSSTAQNTSWTNILSGSGTRLFGGQLPSTGFSPMNGTNFYRLTSGFQTYYTTTGSNPYASNRYSLQAACNVADNSAGAANIVYIRVVLDDPYVDPPLGIPPAFSGPIPPEDNVDGTLTTILDELKATGTLQPAPTTGNFTIVSPTFTSSGWSGS
jgi:hypothetical protein